MQKGKNVTLYLPEEVYDPFKEKCKKIGKTVSQHITDLMRQEITGSGNQTMEAPVDCEVLERDHLKLAKEVDELERRLKRRKVYKDLLTLVNKVKLKPDMSNLDAVTPQLLEEWNRDPKNEAEDAHICITLLRKVRNKKQIESQLEAIRKGRA